MEISGLQKNWKKRVQPQTPSTHRSSITTSESHGDSGDEFDDQNDEVPVASKVQVIQKKQQTSAKVKTPGHWQSNHQEGTKTVY